MSNERTYIPVGNEVYVDIEKETNNTINVGGEELFLDTDFNRFWHARQYGEVKYIPRRFQKEAEDNIDLVKGDKIYVHHFLIDESHTLEVYGEKLYWVPYGLCFCIVRDGELHMLNDYILAKPVLEPEENYKTSSGLFLKAEPEKLERIAKVVKTNHTSHEENLQEGDYVVFANDADYEMEIEGEKYYVMRNKECLLRLDNYEQERPNYEITG